jgi:hypothetical protein
MSLCIAQLFRPPVCDVALSVSALCTQCRRRGRAAPHAVCARICMCVHVRVWCDGGRWRAPSVPPLVAPFCCTRGSIRASDAHPHFHPRCDTLTLSPQRRVAVYVAWGAQNDNTPLHMAAHNDHASVVTLLLERGADKEAKNKVRRTARPRPHRSTCHCASFCPQLHAARGAWRCGTVSVSTRTQRRCVHAYACAWCSGCGRHAPSGSCSVAPTAHQSVCALALWRPLFHITGCVDLSLRCGV